MQAIIKKKHSIRSNFIYLMVKAFEPQLCSFSVIRYPKIYEIKVVKLLRILQLNLKWQIISTYSP